MLSFCWRGPCTQKAGMPKLLIPLPAPWLWTRPILKPGSCALRLHPVQVGDRQTNMRNFRHLRLVSSLAVLGFAGMNRADAQMVAGKDMPGFAETFGLDKNSQALDYAVEQIAIDAGGRAMANVLWPGEKPRITLHFTNKTDAQLSMAGSLEVVRYGTRVPEGEVWVPHAFRIGTESSTSPVRLNLSPRGSEDVVVTPAIPPEFG